jgi:hypothetical protein
MSDLGITNDSVAQCNVASLAYPYSIQAGIPVRVKVG